MIYLNLINLNQSSDSQADLTNTEHKQDVPIDGFLNEFHKYILSAKQSTTPTPLIVPQTAYPREVKLDKTQNNENCPTLIASNPNGNTCQLEKTAIENISQKDDTTDQQQNIYSSLQSALPATSATTEQNEQTIPAIINISNQETKLTPNSQSLSIEADYTIDTPDSPSYNNSKLSQEANPQTTKIQAHTNEHASGSDLINENPNSKEKNTVAQPISYKLHSRLKPIIDKPIKNRNQISNNPTVASESADNQENILSRSINDQSSTQQQSNITPKNETNFNNYTPTPSSDTHSNQQPANHLYLPIITPKQPDTNPISKANNVNILTETQQSNPTQIQLPNGPDSSKSNIYNSDSNSVNSPINNRGRNLKTPLDLHDSASQSSQELLKFFNTDKNFQESLEQNESSSKQPTEQISSNKIPITPPATSYNNSPQGQIVNQLIELTGSNHTLSPDKTPDITPAVNYSLQTKTPEFNPQTPTDSLKEYITDVDIHITINDSRPITTPISRVSKQDIYSARIFFGQPLVTKIKPDALHLQKSTPNNQLEESNNKTNHPDNTEMILPELKSNISSKVPETQITNSHNSVNNSQIQISFQEAEKTTSPGSNNAQILSFITENPTPATDIKTTNNKNTSQSRITNNNPLNNSNTNASNSTQQITEDTLPNLDIDPLTSGSISPTDSSTTIHNVTAKTSNTNPEQTLNKQPSDITSNYQNTQDQMLTHNTSPKQNSISTHINQLNNTPQPSQSVSNSYTTQLNNSTQQITEDTLLNLDIDPLTSGSISSTDSSIPIHTVTAKTSNTTPQQTLNKQPSDITPDYQNTQDQKFTHNTSPKQNSISTQINQLNNTPQPSQSVPNPDIALPSNSTQQTTENTLPNLDIDPPTSSPISSTDSSTPTHNVTAKTSNTTPQHTLNKQPSDITSDYQNTQDQMLTHNTSPKQNSISTQINQSNNTPQPSQSVANSNTTQLNNSTQQTTENTLPNLDIDTSTSSPISSTDSSTPTHTVTSKTPNIIPKHILNKQDPVISDTLINQYFKDTPSQTEVNKDYHDTKPTPVTLLTDFKTVQNSSNVSNNQQLIESPNTAIEKEQSSLTSTHKFYSLSKNDLSSRLLNSSGLQKSSILNNYNTIETTSNSSSGNAISPTTTPIVPQIFEQPDSKTTNSTNQIKAHDTIGNESIPDSQEKAKEITLPGNDSEVNIHEVLRKPVSSDLNANNIQPVKNNEAHKNVREIIKDSNTGTESNKINSESQNHYTTAKSSEISYDANNINISNPGKQNLITVSQQGNNYHATTTTDSKNPPDVFRNSLKNDNASHNPTKDNDQDLILSSGYLSRNTENTENVPNATTGTNYDKALNDDLSASNKNINKLNTTDESPSKQPLFKEQFDPSIAGDRFVDHALSKGYNATISKEYSKIIFTSTEISQQDHITVSHAADSSRIEEQTVYDKQLTKQRELLSNSDIPRRADLEVPMINAKPSPVTNSPHSTIEISNVPNSDSSGNPPHQNNNENSSHSKEGNLIHHLNLQAEANNSKITTDNDFIINPLKTEASGDRINHGITNAQQVKGMVETRKQDQITQDNGQKVPFINNNLTHVEPDAEYSSEQRKNILLNNKKSDTILTPDQPQNFIHQTAGLNKLDEKHNQITDPIISKLHQIILDNAHELRQSGAASISVLVKPDSHTEVVLDLRIKNGEIELRAKCSEDFSILIYNNADTLRDQLAYHGLRLVSINNTYLEQQSQQQQHHEFSANQQFFEQHNNNGNQHPYEHKHINGNTQPEADPKPTHKQTKNLVHRFETWA